MPSIARKNLFEDFARFVVAQAGIMFAVSLVSIQTGIFNGFSRSTALLIDDAQADLWVSSDQMLHFELTLPMPYERVAEIAAIAGVEQAEPLILRSGVWRDALDNIAPVRIIGFDPDSELFAPANFRDGSLSELKEPYTVLIDESNQDSLNVPYVGSVVEMAGIRTKIVGIVSGTQSIASSAFVFTSLESANAFGVSQLTTDPAPFSSLDPPALTPADLISYVLVKASPGEDLTQLKQRIEDTFPDTRIYTRSEMAQKTRNYWQQRTGIGFILGLGAAVGVIVGVVVVSQILYSSVSDHIKEFGTLKAMGASDWVIYRTIVEQALWMAVLGYLPGMALCWAVSTWTLSSQGILILITPTTAIAVFGLTVVMCVGSALFAIQKVNRVDPAVVFKA